ncbi:TadE/TadG family type IV pilus assembly protein [Acidiphilium sp.]|uniref:TadE/TadG family type IV pilus assembly protein n=1 Tax=Acidiphilium sp. TaxID=527 RepID=UPI003D03C9F8
MIAIVRRFLRDKKGAIALIFGFSLIPMAMLVALSIDFSFYTQARAQITLAADAAATHAIRAATETYATEINENPPVAAATAISDADAAGEAAGAAWFAAQLATLPTASVTGPNNPDVIVQSNTNLSATNPAGFTATVAYTGTYPPFFDPLFSSTTNWKITGTAGALSTYSYVEILMMLDNSGSMDIGATPADILKLEQNTVCIPSSWSNTGANGTGAYDPNSPEAINMGQVAHYNDYGNPSNLNGTCASGYQNPPFAPCGFACHTQSNNHDYYGIARSLGVTLREDVVIQSAENVISSMAANEQAPDQFSVGVYQFNSDISPLFPTAVTQTTTANPEASTDLSAALAAVDSIDYNKNPNMVQPVLPNVLNAEEETDLTTSVTDLLAGAYSDGTEFGKPITAAGSGNSQNSPQKDIFIVTDGMEDAASGGQRVLGEMTGVAAENDSYPPTPGICTKFKALKFTVYVLYIEYDPLANTWYETSSATPTSYFHEDFPNVKSPTPQDFAEATSADYGGTVPANAMSPDEAALQACASSPSDFYVATNAAAISTAMNAMLKSALSSAIRITQ